ncbi:Uncharacterised protein [Bordetella pertussis]|nr:Uncharacterised protein [Bordetella pertussis]
MAWRETLRRSMPWRSAPMRCGPRRAGANSRPTNFLMVSVII